MMKKSTFGFYPVFCLLMTFLIGMTAMPVMAEPAGGADDSKKGFSQDEDPWQTFENIDGNLIDQSTLDAENTDEESSFWEWYGFVREEIGYSYEHDDPDFSKIQSTVNMTVDLDLFKGWKGRINVNGFYDYAYTYQGRDKFTEDTLDTYESEAEIRDFYVDGKINDWLYLKIGRQIIAWGESDSVQITDMANPRDLRELGMVDLEDARIPVAATKISVVPPGWEVNLVMIHEFRPNKMPAAGSEFDVLKNLRANSAFEIEDEELPDNPTEYLFRIFKPFNGGDLSIVAADVYDDAYYLDFKKLSFAGGSPKLTVVPRYKRIKMMGMSGNLVSGSWLFKTDFAQKTGVAVARNDQQDQIQTLAGKYVMAHTPATGVYGESTDAVNTWSEKNTLTLMLGVEYSGITDWTFGLEAISEQIQDWEDTLASNEFTNEITVSISNSTWNDTFHTRLFLVQFADNNGTVARLNVDYDVIDALNVSGGIITYLADNEEATVYPFRNNDRVFSAVKYSF